jgi:hypothetical protein
MSLTGPPSPLDKSSTIFPTTIWTMGSEALTSLLRGQPGSDVRNFYYRDVQVLVDGYVFTNCCFENCKLVTNTGVFALKQCRVVNSQVLFGPGGLRVIQLYNAFHGPSEHTVFNPTFSPNGLVTIG